MSKVLSKLLHVGEVPWHCALLTRENQNKHKPSFLAAGLPASSGRQYFLNFCRAASAVSKFLLSLDNVYPLASYECEWHNSFDQSYMLDLVQTFSNLFWSIIYVRSCSKLFKLFLTCSNLLKLVQTCSKLFKPVQNCSNLFKLVQFFSNMLKLVRTCSNLIKIVQIIPNMFKLVQRCKMFPNLFELVRTCPNLFKLV